MTTVNEAGQKGGKSKSTKKLQAIAKNGKFGGHHCTRCRRELAVYKVQNIVLGEECVKSLEFTEEFMAAHVSLLPAEEKRRAKTTNKCGEFPKHDWKKSKCNRCGKLRNHKLEKSNKEKQDESV